MFDEQYSFKILMIFYPNNKWCKHQSMSPSQKSGVILDSFFHPWVSLESLCVLLTCLLSLRGLCCVYPAPWPLFPSLTFLHPAEYGHRYSTLPTRAVFPKCSSDLAVKTWPKCLSEVWSGGSKSFALHHQLATPKLQLLWPSSSFGVIPYVLGTRPSHVFFPLPETPPSVSFSATLEMSP